MTCGPSLSRSRPQVVSRNLATTRTSRLSQCRVQHLAPQARRDRRDPPVQQVLLVLTVQPVPLVQQVPQVLRVPQVIQDRRASRVFRASKVSQVPQDHRVCKASKVFRAIQVRLVLQALTVLLVQQARLVPQAQPGLKAIQVPQVPPVPRALRLQPDPIPRFNSTAPAYSVPTQPSPSTQRLTR